MRVKEPPMSMDRNIILIIQDHCDFTYSEFTYIILASLFDMQEHAIDGMFVPRPMEQAQVTEIVRGVMYEPFEGGTYGPFNATVNLPLLLRKFPSRINFGNYMDENSKICSRNFWTRLVGAHLGHEVSSDEGSSAMRENGQAFVLAMQSIAAAAALGPEFPPVVNVRRHVVNPSYRAAAEIAQSFSGPAPSSADAFSRLRGLYSSASAERWGMKLAIDSLVDNNAFVIDPKTVRKKGCPEIKLVRQILHSVGEVFDDPKYEAYFIPYTAAAR